MDERAKVLGIIGLIAASFFWGAEFVVEKDVLSIMEANYSNAIRFVLASILCTAVLAPRLRTIRKKDAVNGIISGIFMGFGFAFQTMGLSFINAGENALLSSAYILIIPLVEWFLFKRNPGCRIFIYAFIAMVGIALISYEPALRIWRFSAGEFLTLTGSVFYAGAIISIERFATETDSRILSLIQFYIITIISILFALLLEEPPGRVTGKIIIEFLYLIIFATIGAQLLMNYCIKFVSSAAAGIIFSTEAVFAAILGIAFLHEPSSVLLWVGVVLIVGAIALYQAEVSKNMSKNDCLFPVVPVEKNGKLR